MSNKNPRPFIKWAGGKSKLTSQIITRLPNSIETYYEPFIGGGAVFFELAKRKQFKHAKIGDSNTDVANAYKVVKNDVDSLISSLKSDTYKYCKDTFMKIRGVDPTTLSDLDRASRFIYLNRTCFNGLYRVNRSGGFNVPFGKYTNPTICDESNLRSVSECLQNVEVLNGDFSWVLDQTLTRKDSVYFDPPYLPISKTSNFVGYTSTGFGETEHVALSNMFHMLTKLGVPIVMSNSSAELILKLYSDGCNVEKLMASRSVGGSTESRSTVEELIIWS